MKSLWIFGFAFFITTFAWADTDCKGLLTGISSERQKILEFLFQETRGGERELPASWQPNDNREVVWLFTKIELPKFRISLVQRFPHAFKDPSESLRLLAREMIKKEVDQMDFNWSSEDEFSDPTPVRLLMEVGRNEDIDLLNRFFSTSLGPGMSHLTQSAINRLKWRTAGNPSNSIPVEFYHDYHKLASFIERFIDPSSDELRSIEQFEKTFNHIVQFLVAEDFHFFLQYYGQRAYTLQSIVLLLHPALKGISTTEGHLKNLREYSHAQLDAYTLLHKMVSEGNETKEKLDAQLEMEPYYRLSIAFLGKYAHDQGSIKILKEFASVYPDQSLCDRARIAAIEIGDRFSKSLVP